MAWTRSRVTEAPSRKFRGGAVAHSRASSTRRRPGANLTDCKPSAATALEQHAGELGAIAQRWFEAQFSFDRGTQPQRFTSWDRRAWYPLLTIVGSWNAFLLPLLILINPGQWTLPLGINNISAQYVTDTAAILAYTTLAMIPALIFYFIAQRQIVSGLTAGGVKG